MRLVALRILKYVENNMIIIEQYIKYIFEIETFLFLLS